MSGVRMLHLLKYWWKFIQIHQYYCIRHIFRGGFIFREFRESGAIREFNTHAKINLPPIPTQECNLCIRNTSSTVHSACANEWMILISPTSVHDCSPPRSWSADSRKITLAKYMAYTMALIAMRIITASPIWHSNFTFQNWYNLEMPIYASYILLR